MKFKILTAAILFCTTQSLFAQEGTKTIYPLVVSFHSQCCGVPSDSSVRIFIDSFKKENKVKKITAYEIGPLGREGEYDLAFTLSELTTKQAALFISTIKKVEKFPTDRGTFTFDEGKEIDKNAIPRRAKTTEVVF